MGQEEFLRVFCESLDGQVSDSRIHENVNYYRNYIYEKIKEGKSEAEVIDELGNPRLLAKTVIEKDRFASGERDNIFTESSCSGEKNNYDTTFSYNNKVTRLPGWVIGIIAIVIIAVVIGIVFSLLSFFAPVILIVAVAIIAYKAIHNLIDKS